MVEKESMTIFIITHPVPNDVKSLVTIKEEDVVIGVDQALSAIYKQRIKVDLAVGDFDSLKNKGLLHGLNTEELLSEKDRDKENPIYFLGRLAEYKYYNMDQILIHSLEKADSIIKSFQKE